MSLAQAQRSLKLVAEYREQVAGSVRTARDIFKLQKAQADSALSVEFQVPKLEGAPTKLALPSEGTKRIVGAIGEGQETIKALVTSGKAVEQAVKDVLGRLEAQNAVLKHLEAAQRTHDALGTSVTEFFVSANTTLAAAETAVAGNLESFVGGLPAVLELCASIGVREANVTLASSAAREIVNETIGGTTQTPRSIVSTFKAYVDTLESALAEADAALATFKSAFPGIGGAVGTGTLNIAFSLSGIRKTVLQPAGAYATSTLGFFDGVSAIVDAITSPVTEVVAALKKVQTTINTEVVVESRIAVRPIDAGDPELVELVDAEEPARAALPADDDDVIHLDGFFPRLPDNLIMDVGFTRLGAADVEAVEELEAQSVSEPVADVAAPAFDLDGAMDSLTVCISTNDASGAREIIARVRENVNGAPEHTELLEVLKGIESELPA